MKKNLVLVLLSAVLLSGCVFGGDKPVEYDAAEVTEKLVGVVNIGAGEGEYSLRLNTGRVVPLHDGAIELANYVGQRVEVTGQYSGSTLYVDGAVVQ